MRAFISFASEDRRFAEELHFALLGAGFATFYDEQTLPPGSDFNTRIHAGVRRADLFVFLVSPESVQQGRYSLTELGMAQLKWPHPEGRVLPVMVRRVPVKDIPAYLNSVSIYEPRGNPQADVLRVIGALAAQLSRKTRKLVFSLALAITVTAGICAALIFHTPPPITTADILERGNSAHRMPHVPKVEIKREAPRVPERVQDPKGERISHARTRTGISWRPHRADDSLPADAISAGPSGSWYVCRSQSSDGVLSGKTNGGPCIIGLQGVPSYETYDVAVGRPIWSKGGPRNPIAAGTDAANRTVLVCRVQWPGYGYVPGWTLSYDPNECRIAVEKEFHSGSDFDFLVSCGRRRVVFTNSATSDMVKSTRTAHRRNQHGRPITYEP